MRIALHSEIAPGRIAGYVEEHVRIPDNLAATFARLGIHDWTIWRSGHRLFHVVDCDDWDSALEALADDPANLEWQARIGPFVALFRDDDGAERMAPLAQVWQLTAQTRADRS